MATNARVYLDHLIHRQSLRYAPPVADESGLRPTSTHRSDHNIRFADIREDGWANKFVKPDFQRATCAWDPKACATFLSSVLRGRIIPSIILWRSSETGLVYVLDGAHRLSVLRAWMIDDWGDKAGDFYKKNENYQEILDAARATREVVRNEIGLFEDYVEAQKEWNKIAMTGGAPRQAMSEEKAKMAMFYLDIIVSSRTLHAQWEDGDYAAAEESFLAINRQGVPLDELESLLIEYRNGSMARVIMSIASAGASGHYWPNPVEGSTLPAHVLDKLNGMNERCGRLHHLLFVPPFDEKITDVNVPFINAPGHFRLHLHLVELLPLLSEGAAIGGERLPEIMAKDSKLSMQELIVNADELLTRIEKKVLHLGGPSKASLSLALVPLIYWYNRKGIFVRALMYGWVHWLLSGTDSEVQERKIAVSSIRGELEESLIRYKDEFADIQHRGGAGLKSLAAITSFSQKLVEALLLTRGDAPSDRDAKISAIFGAKAETRKGQSGASRAFSRSKQAEINVRELLGSSLRCEICGGVIDLKQGVQYDHKEEHSTGGLTVPENGRPTHPFCNLFRERITNLRAGRETLTLPRMSDRDPTASTFQQLSLFDSFPGD
jgi:hypothetical protein